MKPMPGPPKTTRVRFRGEGQMLVSPVLSNPVKMEYSGTCWAILDKSVRANCFLQNKFTARMDKMSRGFVGSTEMALTTLGGRPTPLIQAISCCLPSNVARSRIPDNAPYHSEIHGWGHVRIKLPLDELLSATPEKPRDVNTPKHPRANNPVAGRPSNQRVPGICKMMKVPTAKIVSHKDAAD